MRQTAFAFNWLVGKCTWDCGFQYLLHFLFLVLSWSRCCWSRWLPWLRFACLAKSFEQHGTLCQGTIRMRTPSWSKSAKNPTTDKWLLCFLWDRPQSSISQSWTRPFKADWFVVRICDLQSRRSRLHQNFVAFDPGFSSAHRIAGWT